MTPLKIQSTMRLTPEDYAKIKIIAEAENRSIANMIETIVKKEIRRYEAENGEITLTEEDLSLE